MRLVWPLAVLHLLMKPHPTFSQTVASKITPRVVIVSMWQPEAHVWYSRFPESKLGNLTAHAIALPGLSMLFPYLFCTEDFRVCQITLGEGEINAAASMMALVLSQQFDLRQSYFLLAGIAGVNPGYATIGSVALARFAVQVALQYEIDPRSLPLDWPTGYISYGRDLPLEYPAVTYGTEVFELNKDLRESAFSLASKAVLADADTSRQYRSKYGGPVGDFPLASCPPSIVRCDMATSDVYYSGTKLAQAFANTTNVWTNGTGVYCMSAQEENASLEVLVRATVDKLADFSRVIVMRAGVSDLQHLTSVDQNGFNVAINNTFAAGIEIVKGIVGGWNCTFRQGISPTNYIGDMFGSLGGKPDFGLGSLTGGSPARPGGQSGDWAKLEMSRRGQFGLRALIKS
ncbi:mitochondrial carrier [Purpureocillium lavendulum]|uniref:Mitochondrial carrier n=1 Tax=Purpureocillium lavendulum TaxID=1247861 RepID=A0AB34FDN8_9HYPO|nr:mitochondrial carrier [Purpureocillium lavendulum]